MSTHQKRSHSTRREGRFTRTRVGAGGRAPFNIGSQSPGNLYARRVLSGMSPAQLDGGQPVGTFIEDAVRITARPVCGPSGRRFNPINLEA